MKPSSPLRWWQLPPFSPTEAQLRRQRRCRLHNYRRPGGRYMITIMASPLLPVLSLVYYDANGKAAVKLSRYGHCFLKALTDWQERYRRRIDPGPFVVMPDHVHFCFTTMCPLDEGEFSRLISQLMGKSTNNLRAMLTAEPARHRQVIANALEKLKRYSIAEWEDVMVRGDYDIPLEDIRFFSKGFADSIGLAEGRWKKICLYVPDNPRRLLFKRANPEYFRLRRQFKIGDKTITACGNIMLLQKPVLEVVRYSSRYTQEYQAKRISAWEECIRTGGALVSPFINPLENAYRKRAIADGGMVIRICENGFPERFAPSGEEFELMTEGRLLLISDRPYDPGKQEMTKAKAMELNRLAELVAGADWLGAGAPAITEA